MWRAFRQPRCFLTAAGPAWLEKMGERKEGNLSTTQLQRERSQEGHWWEQGYVSSDLGTGNCQGRRAGEVGGGGMTRTMVLMPL